MPIIKDLYQAVLEGRRQEVQGIIQRELDSGKKALEIIERNPSAGNV